MRRGRKQTAAGRQKQELLRLGKAELVELAGSFRRPPVSALNPWCNACREDECRVDANGTCAMIRMYHAALFLGNRRRR